MAPVGIEACRERPLGPSEENWIKCTEFGTGNGIFGIALNKLVHIDHVRTAAKAVGNNHSLLRSQIYESAKGKKCFKIMDQQWSPNVQEMPWPHMDDNISADTKGVLHLSKDDEHHSLSIALHQIIEKELNLGFHNADFFEVHAYGDESRCQSVIVLRFHSAACDRHSTAIAAQEFLQALSDSVAGRIPNLSNCSDKNEILPPLEDLVPKKLSKGFFKKGLDAVGYAWNSSKCAIFPFQKGHTDFKHCTLTSQFVRFSLGEEGTQALLAACKKENATIPAALSAALLLEASKWKELKDKKQNTFSFTRVINSRQHIEPPLENNVIGNYSSGMPQDEQVKEGIGFWDLARSLASVTAKEIAKHHHFSELPVLNMLFSQLLKRPSMTPASSLRTALFSVFLDPPAKIEVSQENADLLGVVGTIGPFASMHFIGPSFSVSDTMEGHELCLTFLYADPVHSRDQLVPFLSSAVASLVDASTSA